MATLESKNDARLDFRLNSALKEIIERAAYASGRSVSDFAVSTLLKAAREVLLAEQTIQLSDRDREVFLAMLDADVQPNEALARAAKRYKEKRA